MSDQKDKDSDSLEDGAEDFLDEEEYDDSSWDDEEEGDGSQDGQRAAKKKKSLFSFNAIVIILAVVFGGGFVVMQLTKRGNTIQSAETVAPISRLQMTGTKDNPVFKDVRKEQQPLGLPGDESEKEPVKPALSSPQGLPPLPLPGNVNEKEETVSTSNEPNSLPLPVSRTPSTAASSDILTPIPSEGSDVEDPLAAFRKKKGPDSKPVVETGRLDHEITEGKDRKTAPIVNAGPSAPAVPVMDVTKTDLSAAVPDSSPSEAAKPTALDLPQGHVQVSEGMRSVSSEGGDVLHKELSGLESRLSSIESRLETLSKTPSPVSSAPSKDPDIAILKEDIRRLERELSDAREEKRGFIENHSSLKSSPKAMQKDAPKKESVSASSLAPKKEKTASKETEKRAIPSSTRWEIRAIQPGVAWVAPVGGDDMQTVSVGDTLAGIGVVRKISVVDGLWVVEGTTGRIHQ